MNGLASLLRYQMGGPVGYVDGGQIDSIYNTLFGRSADEGGKAYYEALLKDRSVADAIAIIGGGATGEAVNNEDLREKIAGEVIKAAYSDTLSRSVDEIDPEGLTYYLGQVLYEGLDPTRIDDIFAYSPEAEKFEATLPGITDILKKNAAGGSYSVYTPPPVVTPPAVTDDTGAGAGAGAGAGTGVVTDDTGAGDKIIEPAVDEVNYPYFDDPDADPGRKQITVLDEAGNIVSGPPDKVISGIPTFARQTPSNLTFAPLRRGLAQLRPAMSMTGLTSGQAAFGGVAPTPGQSPPDLITAQDRAKELIDRTYRTVLNRNPTQVGYNFYLPKILSGELNANNIIPTLIGGATSGPDKEVAANYAIQNPSAAQPFALQTGAYGAPTPTFFTPTPAKTTSPSGSSSANANQSFYGSGGDGEGIEGDPNSSGFSFSGFGFGDESGGSVSGTGSPGDESGGSVSGTGSPGDESGGSVSGTGSPGDDNKMGGLIRMAEGGEPTAPPTPPKMTELFPSDLGSAFNSSEFVDDKGRLVGGYSKPIYEDNVLVDYEFVPYKDMSNVVFGRELRDKETAMRLTDAEREQMMIEMAMRQGRTGISPTTGGLAGIQIGDPEELMRRQPQYYSTVEQFRPRYAEGGNVSSTAQNLASRGRGGDTMLVHMAPHEVAGLNALARMQGTELTINPETGMPEALKLGKLFKTLAPFIPFIPGVGQFLAPAFGALGMGGFSPLLQKAITSGIVGGFTGPKGGFDLQRGLMQGITAYGLGSLQQNLGGPSTPGGPPTSTDTGSLSGSPAGVTSASVPIQGTEKEFLAARPEFDRATFDALRSDVMAHPDFSGNIPAPLSIKSPITTPGDITAASKAAEATRAGFPLSDIERGGTSNLGAPFEYEPVSPKNAATTASGMKTPTALLTTGLGVSSTADYDKLTSAGIAVKREKEEEDELYRRLFERSLGSVPVRSGGLMKLAGGGMSYMEAGGTTGPTGAPRDVVGNGDGMSDSVPADIEGVQEARLADGEFVVPADVVADIGNGSSDAGSKKLYDMMDRVRKARHGTTEQPPEIKAERLMPA
jgi:hypothetical protein